jgi:hypothetical protein
MEMQSENLRKHCYAVEAVMKELAKYFCNKEKSSCPDCSESKCVEHTEMWGIAGLLHDADYEKTKEDTSKHTHYVIDWLKQEKADKTIIEAVAAHGWGFIPGAPEPKNNMEWSLYCCDELTGFIIAVALVKGKKLDNVSVDSVLKRFPQTAFARAVNREQITLCEEKLGIPLSQFVEITLKAMKGIKGELGL